MNDKCRTSESYRTPVTHSLWRASVSAIRGSVLRKPITVDVCVIGGGITGLSVAYHLLKEGRSVAVLDAGRIGCGETGVTSAHLVTALDRRYADLLASHGFDRTRLIAESHRHAIGAIEQIAKTEHISCDFEYCDGYLIGVGEKAEQIIDDERDAARRAGVGAVPVETHRYTRIGGPSLRFPRQAKFHPLKYLHGLATAIRHRGGHLHHNTTVKELVGGPDAHVVTDAGITVHAGHIVMATNTPINYLALHPKLSPHRSYVVGFTIPAADAFNDLVWDTAEPFHYVRCYRPAEGDAILIAGGEDHKTGQADDTPEHERLQRLESWTRQHFPSVGVRHYAWSGQIMETLDGIAYIGKNPGDADNVLVATGDCGNGLTHGTIAGLLLTDLIVGRNNPWAAVYDPSRTRLASTWKLLKENANVAVQYADWLTAGDVPDANAVPRECGAVLRRGLKKIAVYRDADDHVHEFSAVCPHLGCMVAWNSAEHSWDCPCHGSRFAPTGEVLNGPALGGLESVDAQQEPHNETQHEAENGEREVAGDVTASS